MERSLASNSGRGGREHLSSSYGGVQGSSQPSDEAGRRANMASSSKNGDMGPPPNQSVGYDPMHSMRGMNNGGTYRPPSSPAPNPIPVRMSQASPIPVHEGRYGNSVARGMRMPFNRGGGGAPRTPYARSRPPRHQSRGRGHRGFRGNRRGKMHPYAHYRPRAPRYRCWTAPFGSNQRYLTPYPHYMPTPGGYQGWYSLPEGDIGYSLSCDQKKAIPEKEKEATTSSAVKEYVSYPLNVASVKTKRRSSVGTDSNTSGSGESQEIEDGELCDEDSEEENIRSENKSEESGSDDEARLMEEVAYLKNLLKDLESISDDELVDEEAHPGNLIQELETVSDDELMDEEAHPRSLIQDLESISDDELMDEVHLGNQTKEPESDSDDEGRLYIDEEAHLRNKVEESESDSDDEGRLYIDEEAHLRNQVEESESDSDDEGKLYIDEEAHLRNKVEESESGSSDDEGRLYIDEDAHLRNQADSDEDDEEEPQVNDELHVSNQVDSKDEYAEDQEGIKEEETEETGSLANYHIPFRTATSPSINLRIRACGTDDSQPWLLPDPEDCGSYFACNGNFYVHQKCPQPLHFDPEQGRCEHPNAENKENSSSSCVNRGEQ